MELIILVSCENYSVIYMYMHDMKIGLIKNTRHFKYIYIYIYRKMSILHIIYENAPIFRLIICKVPILPRVSN